jgi:hypothetical protein
LAGYGEAEEVETAGREVMLVSIVDGDMGIWEGYVGNLPDGDHDH